MERQSWLSRRQKALGIATNGERSWGLPMSHQLRSRFSGGCSSPSTGSPEYVRGLDAEGDGFRPGPRASQQFGIKSDARDYPGIYCPSEHCWDPDTVNRDSTDGTLLIMLAQLWDKATE